MSRPAFMADDLPTSAPELGDLTVGSQILVVEPSYHRRRVEDPRPTNAVVTRKARIWITAESAHSNEPDSSYPTRYRKTWDLRMDNQTDGNENSYHATRFYTPDQYRFRQASISASQYLTDQGVRLDWASPWKDEARTIELARTIWTLARVDSKESGDDR